MTIKWYEFREMASLWLWTLRLLWQSHLMSMVTLSFATIAQAVIAVAQLWVVKLLMDKVIWAISLPPDLQGPDAVLSVLLYVGFEGALLLAGIGLITISSHAFNVLSEHFSYNVRFRILEKAARLDLASYESATYYDQLQRAQREAGVGPTQLLRRITESAQAILGLGSIIGLIMLYQPLIVVILIAATLPSFYVVAKFGRRRFILFDGRTPEGRRAGYLSQVLSSDTYAKEVRIWQLEQYLVQQIETLFQRFKRENIILSLRESWASFGGEVITAIGYYSSYVMVVLSVVSGQLTVGDLTLYAGAFSRTQSYFEQVLNSIARTYEALLFARNLKTFLALDPTVTSLPNAQSMPPTIERIEVSDLSFIYPETDKTVLNRVKFTIERGECVAVVGINGAGKTSLVKLLLRLYDPTNGRILINGVDLRQLDLESWRRNIAVVFQDYAKYQLSLQENIGFGRIEDINNLANIDRAATEAGIGYLSSQLPKGFETILGRRFEGGHELSIGQWQRIALARALLRDAPLLILDEPSSALDAQAEYELYAQLKSLAQGRITILISHRFSTVRMADRILVIQDGQIIEQGTHESLLSQDTEYARLFKLQAENYQIDSTTMLTSV